MNDEQDDPGLAARRRTLGEREAGTGPDDTLHEGVPPWLTRSLTEWLGSVVLYEAPRMGMDEAQQRLEHVARSVLARYRLSTTTGDTYGWHIIEFVANEQPGVLRSHSGVAIEALDLVDGVVGLHFGWPDSGPRTTVPEIQWWAERLVHLERLLSDAGSAWTVDVELRGLYRRVPSAVVEARRVAAQTAHDAGRVSAAGHLNEAWRQAYGRDPNPTGSYASAMKAVESAGCPVVLEKATANGTAMLHQVPGELTQNASWRLVLPDGESTPPGPGSALLVADMVRRLGSGQTERHDNSNPDRNRPSTVDEARAAVHLAVTLVQWFSSGAVTR